MGFFRIVLNDRREMGKWALLDCPILFYMTKQEKEKLSKVVTFGGREWRREAPLD